jgi:hypothetical protein
MLKSGHPRADRFLADHYLSVRGMSSRFAAAIAAGLLRIQSESGASGHVAEIGAFEGRFLIALAHALEPGESCIGIDHFSWPDEGLKGRFEANIATFAPPDIRFHVLKADSRKLTPSQLRSIDASRQIRFVHVDGEHTPEHLTNDLELAAAAVSLRGVLCLDDMLHPGYPLLPVTVDAFLRAHPELRVFCVIDREDIVGAAKFMLCRNEDAQFYAAALAERFPQHVWGMQADFGAYASLVLAPEPKLADIG